MQNTQQFVILGIGLVLLIALMFWPQWQARRRQQQQMKELKPGDQIVTVGGIIGKLTSVNSEENRATIEVAPGVEIAILPAAISRTIPPALPEEIEGEAQPEDQAPSEEQSQSERA